MAAIAAMLLGPRAAAAQQPTTSSTPSSSQGFFLGGSGGISVVKNVGAHAGGELGYHLTNRLDLLGEGYWLQNVATQSGLNAATQIATYLQGTQGQPASGTLRAPAFYLGGALRFMLTEPARARPYVVFGGGAGWITRQPTFTLGGSDVTSALNQYGVVLGSDLTGRTTNPAFIGGFGLQLVQNQTYINIEVRATSIRTSGTPTTATSIFGGFGYRF